MPNFNALHLVHVMSRNNFVGEKKIVESAITTYDYTIELQEAHNFFSASRYISNSYISSEVS